MRSNVVYTLSFDRKFNLNGNALRLFGNLWAFLKINQIYFNIYYISQKFFIKTIYLYKFSLIWYEIFLTIETKGIVILKSNFSHPLDEMLRKTIPIYRSSIKLKLKRIFNPFIESIRWDFQNSHALTSILECLIEWVFY